MLDQGGLSRWEAMKREQYLRRVELSKLPAVTQPGSWLCHTQLWPRDAVSCVREARALSEYLWAAGRSGELDWQLCRHWWKWRRPEKVLSRPWATGYFFHQIEIREELPISCCFPEWRRSDHFSNEVDVSYSCYLVEISRIPELSHVWSIRQLRIVGRRAKVFLSSGNRKHTELTVDRREDREQHNIVFHHDTLFECKNGSERQLNSPLYKPHSNDNPEKPIHMSWEFQVIWHAKWELSSAIEWNNPGKFLTQRNLG